MPGFLIAFVALAATAALAAACFERSSFVSFLLAAYLLASAEVVALTEVLSFGHWVRPLGYAVGEAALLAVAVLAWVARGRPLPVLPRVSLRAAVRSQPVVAALGAAVALALGYEGFVAFTTAPNNWDSMIYHLVRAAEWLQRGAVEWVPHAATTRVNSMPPNAEIEVTYTLAFLHRDTLAAAPQFAAELAVMVGVFGIARRLGFSRAGAALAALLTPTLSEIALQAVTTQNDLLVTSFVVACAYSLLRASSTDAIRAGLALGLAAGTKLTLAFALPSLVLLALVGPARRRLAVLATATVASFALVGAYGYVLNEVKTGHLSAPDPLQADYRPHGVRQRLATFGWISFHFVDLTGYRRVLRTRPAAKAVAALGLGSNRFGPPDVGSFSRINIDPFEDVSYFGPLGFLLVVPLALGGLVALCRQRLGRLFAPFVLALPLYVSTLALFYLQNPQVARFIVTPVALTMPLAGVLVRYRVLTAVACAIAVVTLGLTEAYNVTKPTGLGSAPAVWTLDRLSAQTLFYPALRPPFAAVDARVPETGRIGVLLVNDDWTYPLYGPELRRRLVPLHASDPLREAEALGLRSVLSSARVPAPKLDAGWSRRRFAPSGWTLSSRSSS